MGMVVRTNTMAMNAYRQLGVNNTAVGKSLEKLSSGFRINRAADDASGLAISEKMKAQIKGLEQASANSQDGISLIQTAEGATTEIHNMLNRMVELATKSANGTIQDPVDREAIQQEVNDLNSEITRIAESTNFNGINLLDGNLGGQGGGFTTATIKAGGGKPTEIKHAASKDSFSVDVAAGNGNGATFTVNYIDADGKAQSKDLSYQSNGTQQDNIEAIMNAVKADKELNGLFDVWHSDGGTKLNIVAKEGGTKKGSVTSVSNADQAGAAGGTSNAASVKGTDAYSTYNVKGVAWQEGDSVRVGDKTFTYAAGADGSDGKTFENLAALIDAADRQGILVENDDPLDPGVAITFKYKDGTQKGLKLQVGDTNDTFNHVTVSVDDLTAVGLGLSDLDVSTQDAAGDAIDVIKTAINKVSTNRANLGSLQNRLEYTINNLDTTAENMTAANSRIRDTDMAKEMMNYTKMNILTQSAQAMLAQANQQPQAILQLLQ